LNTKFKNTINLIAASDLRAEAIGHDKQGNAYWCFIDEKCNLKVYQENADDETWQLVASNREEMVQLIQKLKGNIPIKPCLDDMVDEDSSSNSCLPPKLVEQVKPEAMDVENKEIPQPTEVVQPKVEQKELDKDKKLPEKAKAEQSVDEEEDYKEIDEDESSTNSSEELTKTEEGSKKVVAKLAIQKKNILPTKTVEPPKTKKAEGDPKKLEIPEDEYSDEELEGEETDYSTEDDLPAVAPKKLEQKSGKPIEKKPVTPKSIPQKGKVAPKLLQKPQEKEEDEEEYSDEEFTDEEYSDEEEVASGSKPTVKATADATKPVPTVPSKAKATEKVIPQPEYEYSDEELEEEESDFSSEEEKRKILKKPQVFMKPAANLASTSQKMPEIKKVVPLATITKVSTPPKTVPSLLAKDKPKIALNKPVAASKNEDTADSEADYDDLEEEEDEIDDDEGMEDEEEDSEVGEEIVEPVMHIKGAGTGKANKSINSGGVENDVLEFGEVIEEEVLFVYGDGAGQASMVGNPCRQLTTSPPPRQPRQ
jgi:hypothetical protein